MFYGYHVFFKKKSLQAVNFPQGKALIKYIMSQTGLRTSVFQCHYYWGVTQIS